jgi:hypothetical protein
MIHWMQTLNPSCWIVSDTAENQDLIGHFQSPHHAHSLSMSIQRENKTRSIPKRAQFIPHLHLTGRRIWMHSNDTRLSVRSGKVSQFPFFSFSLSSNDLGTPLDIRHLPSFDLLHPGEVHIASTLRLPPEQYLRCKHSLLVHAQQFNQSNLPFRKSDAQKCVRIDVNKTSALWTVFYQLGWFKPRS